MKTCTRCKIEKDDTEFRLRNKPKNGKDCFYLNPTCRKCDAELSNEYHQRKSGNAEFRRKHAQYAKERYWRERDKMLQRAKEYRGSAPAKENRKRYIEKNKEKIYQQEVLCKKKYHEKNKNPITDKYIKNLLRTQDNRNPSKDEIEIKRAEVLLSRIRKMVSVKKIGESKKCTKCKKEKDLSEFYIIRKKNYRMAICKECSNENCRHYREKNKNKTNEC